MAHHLLRGIGAFAGVVLMSVGWGVAAPPAHADPPTPPSQAVPSDGATGVALDAGLSVQVSHDSGEPLQVTFTGRDVSANGEPFSIVVLPDTQKYSTSDALLAGLTAQRDWILANRESAGIKAIIQNGDIQENTGNSGSAVEWDRVMPIYRSLQLPDVPLAITPGNHDYSRVLLDNTSGDPAPRFDQNFPVGSDPGSLLRFGWAGGYMGQPGSEIAGTYTNRGWKNNYVFFSAAGMDFIVISVEFDFPYETIQWLDAVLGRYPNHRAILNTHQWLEDTSSASISTDKGATGGSPAEAWSAIRDRCNLFLVVSGHNHSAGGERSRVELNDCGQPVQMQMADYQSRANGGSGWLRHLTFTPTADQVVTRTYSPYLQQSENDPNSLLTWACDMPMGPGPWTLVGSVTVPLGTGTAAVQWPGLAYLREYEWYVDVGHGSDMVSTQSTPWSFTTAAPPVDPPPVEPVSVTVSVVDDASVVEASPTTNYGADNQLYSRGSPAQQMFLRFGLPAAPAGAVLTSATLRLRTSGDAAAGTAVAHAVDLVEGAWTESGVTWANRPTSVVAGLGSIPAVATTNTAFTVPLAVGPLAGRVGSSVTVRVSSAGTDNLRLFSSEYAGGGYRPQLELLFAGGAPADTTAPTVPGSPAAVVDGNAVTVSWSASSDNVAVTGYELFRGASAGFAPAVGNRVGTTTGLSHVDPGLGAGTYYYKVRALDAAGNASAATAAVSAVVAPPADTQAPTVPTGVSASVSGSSVTVSWSASSDNVGVTGYRVYRGTSAGFEVGDGSLVGSPSGLSFTDSGLAVGTYYYVVRARDAAGNVSGNSAVVSVTVVSPPVEPVSVAVSVVDDASVVEASPSTNYGSDTQLFSRGSPAQQVFLRFGLPAAPAGAVLMSATLRLRTSGDPAAGTAVAHAVDLVEGAWTESGVTWSNRPRSVVAGLGSIPAVATTNTAFTVPLAVGPLGSRLGSSVTVRVSSAGTDNLRLFSREYAGGGYRPQLELVYG